MNDIFCKICGMRINENNYDFNMRAIPERNDKSVYIYCPFCGVSHKYLVQHKNRIISIESEEISDETKAILIKAAKLEVFNGDFYKIASQKSKNVENVEMFKGLCNIEYAHARIHKKLAGMKENIQLREMNYNSINSDEELIRATEEREKHAVEFYMKNINLIQENKVKEVFKALIEVEKDHINMAKGKI